MPKSVQNTNRSFRSRKQNMQPPSGAHAGAFEPQNITNLKGWWDFSDSSTLFTDAGVTRVSADGDAIGTALDKSGQSNSVLQATAVNKPAYKVGIQHGRSVSRHATAGGNDYLMATSFTGGDLAQPNTVYLVANRGIDAAYFDGVAGKRHLLWSATGVWQIYAGTGPVGAGVSDTAFHVFACIFNGASSKLYVAGGSANAAGDAGANVLGGIVLGADVAFGSPLSGDIGEVLVYAGAHTTTNLDKVGDYLASKWGLAWSASS